MKSDTCMALHLLCTTGCELQDVMRQKSWVHKINLESTRIDMSAPGGPNIGHHCSKSYCILAAASAMPIPLLIEYWSDWAYVEWTG